jgi:acetate kinase
MIVLVLNCGSSSAKYKVMDMHDESDYDVLAKGLIDRIGLDSSNIMHEVPGSGKYIDRMPIPDHRAAIKKILEILVSKDKDKGVLDSLDDIKAVGNRITHGGDYFSDSARVNEEVLEKIKKCCALAPLHNPSNLMGITVMNEMLPDIPQVAVFDTAFHQTLPDYAYMYGLPYEYYEKDKIRKYGFHGTSHKFVANKGAAMCGLDIKHSKIITCHLGNGSSIAAILNGRSIDTSMGYTPTEGIVMGTRCGSVDPMAILAIEEKYGYTPQQMKDIINKKSGFVAISNISSDARDVENAASKGNHRAELALDMMRYDVIKYIGSYVAEMNGVDLICFTGGMGENDPVSRAVYARHLEYLGVDFNFDLNDGLKHKDAILTNPGSKVILANVTTDEELVIAQDTMRLAFD